MRTYIQLKDNVGFAVVNTNGETEGIEVEFGTGEQYLKKIHNDGVWEDAPLIWYAELNDEGTIIEIKKTYFSSEVGNNPVLTPDVKPYFKYVDGQWIDPTTIVVVVPQSEIEAPTPTTEETINEVPGDTVQ